MANRREFTKVTKREALKERLSIYRIALENGAEPRSKSKNMRWIENLLKLPFGEECILWPFSKRESGYGQIVWKYKRTTSHRVICEMYRGPAPFEGAHAAHECGNRQCCNPSHIVWKTAKENAEDKEVHGTQLKGSKTYNAKLTESDVLEIRSEPSKLLSNRILAKKYGVCIQNICDIRNRKHWRHV
jgi:hypothetical protein